MRRHGPSPAAKLLFLLVFFGLFLGLCVLALRVGPVPKLTVEAHPDALGPDTTLVGKAEAKGRGLESLRLELSQGQEVRVIAERKHQPKGALALFSTGVTSDTLEGRLGPEGMKGLRKGEATLRLIATRASTFARHPASVVAERTIAVRTSPPTIAVVSTQHYLTQGGSEVVVYKVSETAASDGVRAADQFFPGRPLPGGGPGERFALFACPWDVASADQIRIVATDDVGNSAAVPFVDRFTAKVTRPEAIPVSEAILNRVVPAIVASSPGFADKGSPLDNFLAVNRDMRKTNAETIRGLASRSAPRFLWKAPFMAMPNAKVMSAFAQPRTYTFEGREVDRQTHLGFDLAVVAGAAVPAANDGMVVFAGYLGIYGNTVILDHGFGLMTIYAHLSSLSATEGQEVGRGFVIGRTGATGLAAGDHLHFSTLLQGLPVDPSEWWDGHWIQDRLVRKLGAALPYEYTAPAKTKAKPKAAKSKAKPKPKAAKKKR